MPVRNWDPTPYPDARTRRTVAGDEATAAAAVTLPRAARWMFSLREITDLAVNTAVSRRFRGPLFIDNLAFAVNLFMGAAAPSILTLRYSDEESGEGFNGFSAATPSGIALIEHDVSGPGPIVLSAGEGIAPIQSAGGAAGGATTIPIKEYITGGDKFLKATLRARTGSVNICWGIVTLYEQVDPELVLDLY